VFANFIQAYVSYDTFCSKSVYQSCFFDLLCIKGYEAKKFDFSWYFRFQLSEVILSSKLRMHLPKVGFLMKSP